MSLSHEVLFGSNKTKPAVRAVYGVSGSGKTVFLSEMLKQASRSKAYGPLWRAIVFDVKWEGYAHLLPEKVKPAEDINEIIESMKKSRITVVHPDLKDSLDLLESTIDHLFATAQRVPDFSATLVLEESSTFIGANAGSIPPGVKRFATQGRSLGLTLILANQRALGNKWVDTQATSLTMFRLARPDADMLRKRWGLNPDEIELKLSEKKFSFSHFDLESLKLDYYNPIEISPKRQTAKAEIKPPKRQKTFGSGLGPEGGFKPFGL